MARARNPADYATGEQRALQAAATAFFAAIRRIPTSLVSRAIRTGSARVITGSAQYRAALARARAAVTRIEVDLLARGLRSGLSEVPGTRLGSTVGALAEKYGAPRAIRLVQGIDSSTRATIRALTKTTARQYAANPSLATLRDLARQIQPLIGVTPKQAAQLRRQWRALAKEGLSVDAIRPVIKARAARMVELRAFHVGDRGVVESISFGRHQGWIEAQDAGELSEKARKRWRDQRDGNERDSHRATTQVGSIPLRKLYPIQHVQHPPSNDRGCRCWEELVPDPTFSKVKPRKVSKRARAKEAADRAAFRRRVEARRKNPIKPKRAASGAPKASAPRAPAKGITGKLLTNWVNGSWNKGSIHLQEAVRREFGLKVALYNRKGWPITDALAARNMAPAREIYTATQRALRGRKTIKLYRGGKHTKRVLGGVMESWTTDLGIARKFAGRHGVIMEEVFPVSRVFAYSGGPNWINGRFGEQAEWIIMGD